MDPAAAHGASNGLLPGPDRPQCNSRNQLNTMNGCYIPCLLNILGAVLFLRVGFSVGMMGLWGSLGIFAFSELIAYLTITSFSAIVTNGRMAGGGAYYMISRNLGPAFGGSSGLMFWFTYCLNVTFNTVSFTETFQETFFPKDSWWGRDDNYSQEVISTITLFVLFLVAYKGAGTFAKVNWLIFAGLLIALAASIGSLFFARVSFELDPVDNAGRVHSGTFSPWSFSTVRDNMWPQPVPSDECAAAAAFGSGTVAGQTCNLQLVFSVIFPAVVGMMEGANLSGDLRDPGHSIPLGTVAAVSTAFFCYILLIVGQAGTVSREMLQFDMHAMQHATVGHGYFVVLGVATACLSTALGSMFGSARILQAIARDDIFPGLGAFKYGTPRGDEPRVAIVFSYLIAEAGILLGGLDDVAPILTNFFLLAYFLVNLACFLLVVSRVPNFRPTFRCYSWPTSLLGCVLIIVVMFYLQWVYALATFFVVAVLFAFVSLRFRGRGDWIDISQAVLFRWSRRGLLNMQGQRQDPKYWRPSLLLLLRAGQSTESPEVTHLVGFLNRAKESGLFVIGQALVRAEATTASGMSEELSKYHGSHAQLSAALPGLQAFPQLSVAPTGPLACMNLILGAGLGSMAPDTVAMTLKQSGGNSISPVDSPEDFLQVMQDVADLKKNLLLAANFSGAAARPASPGGAAARVDIWVIGDVCEPLSSGSDKDLREKTQLSLLLQMGMLCRTQGTQPLERARPTLRLVHCVASAPGAAEDGQAAVGVRPPEDVPRRWLRWARIPHADVKVVQVPKGTQRLDAESCSAEFQAVNEQMRLHSSDACMVLALLPGLPSGRHSSVSRGYLENLCALVALLPPTVLTMNGQGFPIITTVI